MISERALLLEIRKEAAYFRRLEETDFVSGILGGLKIAVFLLDQAKQNARNFRKK